MAVILDLDLTLVDSGIAEPLRKKRNWPGVYKLIPKFTMYEGILELLAFLKKKKIPVCIVTSSPRPYCERVMEYFGIKADYVVCYHDTQNHKPHPAPIQLAIKHLKHKECDCYSLGDHVKDIVSSRDAGVKSIGCLWGSEDAKSIHGAKPDIILKTPQEALAFFQSIYK